jgi:hypothetical protein
MSRSEIYLCLLEVMLMQFNHSQLTIVNQNRRTAQENLIRHTRKSIFKINQQPGLTVETSCS